MKKIDERLTEIEIRNQAWQRKNKIETKKKWFEEIVFKKREWERSEQCENVRERAYKIKNFLFSAILLLMRRISERESGDCEMRKMK